MIHEIGAIISLFADDETEDGKFLFRVTELMREGWGSNPSSLTLKAMHLTVSLDGKFRVAIIEGNAPHYLGGI